MNVWQTIVLGIVEGLTEFLPVSSTGHLILASRLMHIKQSEFLSSFNIAIQLGAVMAVVFLYGRTLLLDQKVLRRVAAAFIPTAAIGIIFYKVIKHVLMRSELVVVWSLFVGGFILIVFELFYNEREHPIDDIRKLSYKQAALIGVFQSLAMVPGISRSAATIVGGLYLGLQRKTIVEFSFLLSIPTMAAATGLDMIKSAAAFSMDQMGILILGFLVAFFVAMISVKFLLYFIKKHDFVVFGVYRIAVVFLFLVLWTR
ncbi:MAG: undecaprenyl-diphosphatase UppP [Candidatus Omnitrophica bacterium]|nr:undecaprenyl-diphosphatase UppP [Candidatus Omnitrophota bacterium]